MIVKAYFLLSDEDKALAKRLWEDNMQEPWFVYDKADMFVVLHDEKILGGFAVYRDNSEGVSGLFCSGWTARHSKVPADRILQRLADSVGDILFKTDKRPAKFLLEKIGKKVKNTERFVYYIIRGNQNGTTE